AAPRDRWALDDGEGDRPTPDAGPEEELEAFGVHLEADVPGASAPELSPAEEAGAATVDPFAALAPPEPFPPPPDSAGAERGPDPVFDLDGFDGSLAFEEPGAPPAPSPGPETTAPPERRGVHTAGPADALAPPEPVGGVEGFDLSHR